MHHENEYYTITEDLSKSVKRKGCTDTHFDFLIQEKYSFEVNLKTLKINSTTKPCKVSPNSKTRKHENHVN